MRSDALHKRHRLPAVADVDGRTRFARRYAQILDAVQDDLGGLDQLTEVQRQLIERFAALSVWAELEDAKMLAGKRTDVERYARIAGNIRRIADALGYQRVVRRPTDLSSYLKEKTSNA